jgi:hypothetical protein
LGRRRDDVRHPAPIGLLTLVVAFLSMRLAELVPITLNMSRPYAATSAVVLLFMIG